VIYHKKVASQVDPTLKSSNKVQFRVPKLFPDDTLRGIQSLPSGRIQKKAASIQEFGQFIHEF
jgi:hypothetical protein